jgi:hypothetical protein
MGWEYVLLEAFSTLNTILCIIFRRKIPFFIDLNENFIEFPFVLHFLYFDNDNPDADTKVITNENNIV